MGMIPESVYQTITRKLRGRDKMKERAEARLMRARMKAGISSSGNESGSGSGGHISDRTGQAAVAIVTAERNLQKVMQWLRVFETVDAIYPPESNEGHAAYLIFRKFKTQQDVCRMTGCTRSTVRRWIDNYIFRCALIATAEGLIDKRELTHGPENEK